MKIIEYTIEVALYLTLCLAAAVTIGVAVGSI